MLAPVHMKFMTAIYNRIRHRVGDSWAYGTGSESLAAGDEEYDELLRTLAFWFHEEHFDLSTTALDKGLWSQAKAATRSGILSSSRDSAIGFDDLVGWLPSDAELQRWVDEHVLALRTAGESRA
jgi:hypothetical protein